MHTPLPLISPFIHADVSESGLESTEETILYAALSTSININYSTTTSTGKKKKKKKSLCHGSGGWSRVDGLTLRFSAVLFS